MSWLTPIWSLPVAIAALVVGAAVVAVAGWRLAQAVDQLADRTGLGEALAGALLLATATSLPGLIVTAVAAASAIPSLAISNSVGGIAAQVAFIVIADLLYRPANLEHAAASLPNLFNAFLTAALLAIVAMATAAPNWSWLGVSPATPLLIAGYLFGLRTAQRIGKRPMWQPRPTEETREDEPDGDNTTKSLSGLITRFVLLGAVVASGGWMVGRAGLSLLEQTDLGATTVGAFLASVATSLPELVTTIAAVRIGAVTMAVSGIVAGNTFDVLFVAVGDLFYREGSIYSGATPGDVFIIAWAILLVVIQGSALTVRDRKGVGFEGTLILLAYLGGLLISTTVS